MDYIITNLYNMYNHGELMQLEGLQRCLEPHDTLCIASVYSYIDTQECERLGIKYCGDVQPASKPKLAIKCVKLLTEALLYSSGLFKAKGIIKRMVDCDAVIDMGGDTFSDDVSLLYSMVHCFPLLLAVILRKPFVVCSQSVGYFKSWLTKGLSVYVLRKAQCVWVRDIVSQRYLNKCGVNTICAPDIAFVLGKQDV